MGNLISKFEREEVESEPALELFKYEEYSLVDHWHNH